MIRQPAGKSAPASRPAQVEPGCAVVRLCNWMAVGGLAASVQILSWFTPDRLAQR